jgi:hypothetical protein
MTTRSWPRLGLAGVIVAVAMTAGADVPRPAMPRGQGESCVEPTDVMRRDHFEFIQHQRDETVHLGIRSSRHSLAGCVRCHAGRDNQGQWRSVDDEGQFCQSCHAYAAVRIDCFGCHSAVPEGDPAAAPHVLSAGGTGAGQ